VPGVDLAILCLKDDATRPATFQGAQAASFGQGAMAMATVTTEAASGRIAEPKATAGKTGTVPRRRRGPRAAEPSTARFFLIKTSGNGTVELGQEVASENEAMVESFRVGGSFAVVTEWKAQVDLATGVPVIKKEAVKSEKKVAHS
jgi:hypothetical protein